MYRLRLVISASVLTWVTERPGSVHVAYVRRDAHRQDAVQQGDEATVPLVAPGPVNAAQEEVKRGPEGQGQDRREHDRRHPLFCTQKQANKQKKNQLDTFPGKTCQLGITLRRAWSHFSLCYTAYSTDRRRPLSAANNSPLLEI